MDIRDLRPPVEDGPWPPLTQLPPMTFEPLARATSWQQLIYAQGGGFRPLLMDVHVPATPRPAPVVLWVHGGGWGEGDRRLVPLQWGQQEFFQQFVDAGIAVATCDYRLIAEAPVEAMVQDIVAAIRYLRRYAGELALDADRVAVWGDSAGSHLSSLAALAGSAPDPDPAILGSQGVGEGRADVTGIVWWYGASDLTVLPELCEFLWATATPEERTTLAERYSPVTHLRADSPPLLIMHGDQDTMAPFDQAVRLHEAAVAVGAPSRLLVVPGAEHAFLGADIRAQWQTGLDFLAGLFAGGRAPAAARACSSLGKRSPDACPRRVVDHRNDAGSAHDHPGRQAPGRVAPNTDQAYRVWRIAEHNGRQPP